MKLTTLMDVYNCCKAIDSGDESDAHEILMTDEEITSARVCIDKCLSLENSKI